MSNSTSGVSGGDRNRDIEQKRANDERRVAREARERETQITNDAREAQQARENQQKQEEQTSTLAKA